MNQIELRNDSVSRFVGWKRVTINKWPTHMRGTILGRKFAIGRNLGIVNKVLDIHVDLQPGEMFTVRDLTTQSVADPWKDDYLPEELLDPANHFGIPTINGIPLQLHWIKGPPLLPWKDDGAAKLVKFAGRVSPMVYATVFLLWYPGQRWSPGIVAYTCSNCSLPDLTAPFVFRFTFGNKEVVQTVELNDDYIGDGQRRAVPFSVIWNGASDEDKASANAHAALQIVGRGVESIGPFGIVEQARFNPVVWKNQNLWPALNNLRSYQSSQVGVVASSTDAGDQEDQCIGWHHEALYPGGIGCEVVRYLAALGQARQPCHHLENNGDPVTAEKHPSLVLWQGRPHWHRGVSPDQLGKIEQLSKQHTHGWWGPDREHLLINSIATSYELTGDPFLQEELEFHARNFIMEDTLDPKLSTSGPDAARSRGWRGIFVVHMWRLLEDRVLAEQVKRRWLDRMDMVYIPSQKNQWLWDNRRNEFGQFVDKSINPYFNMVYQAAVAAYGEGLACLIFGHKEGMLLAIEQASRIVQHAYDDTLTEWEIIGIAEDGSPASKPYTEFANAHRTGWYRFKWLPFAVYTATYHSNPDIAGNALSLYQRLLQEYRNRSDSIFPADWFVPLQMPVDSTG